MPEYRDETIANNAEYHRQGSEVLTKYLDGVDLKEQVDTDPALVTTEQAPWRVSMEVLHLKVQIIFDIIDSIILGRSTQIGQGFEGIDLTPFDAHFNGVSRHHAKLILDHGNVVLQDMDSTNGTGINGRLLQPHINYILHSGDVMHLGKLQLRVRFLYNAY